MTSSPADAERAPPLSSYQRWLFFFLGVAGFFEGYDSFAFTQLLPQIREEMAMSKFDAGLLVGFINIGAILAYPLVRLADRWGRRRILTITILGYTACTLLTGIAPNAAAFGGAQLLARVFLVAEWAIATVYAAEEFPAARRGTVIGVIHGLNGFGAIACAGIAPEVLKTSFGWRGVYFVGAIPLLLMAFARRSLRETRRFEEQVATRGPDTGSLFRLPEAPFRRRMLLLALIWWLTYFCSTTAITFWKEHAMAERALTDEGVRAHVTIAALVAMPLAFTAGKLIDTVGRRWGAVIIYTMVVLGTLGSYSAPGKALVVVSLILGMGGITAVGVVLGAYTAELFPTHVRGDAFGWSNQLLGRLAPIMAPVAVGFGAERIGWGRSVSLTALFPCLALALILLLLPETRGRELEETSAARPG
jgi:putative MFS transporter